MAVAEMKKFNLVAMSYDRNALLDALQRTGAVEVKEHGAAEHTTVPVADAEELRARYSRAEEGLEKLLEGISEYERRNKLKSAKPGKILDISYTEFMAAGGREATNEAEALLARIEELFAQRAKLTAEKEAVRKERRELLPYARLDAPFSAFADTAHTSARLGKADAGAREKLLGGFAAMPLAECGTSGQGETVAFWVFFHKSVQAEADALIGETGFESCPFRGAFTAEERLAELSEKKKAIGREFAANDYALYELNGKVRGLKVYCDRLAYELEKAELAEKLRVTERTFLLEGYVPAEAVNAVTEASYSEFSDPAPDEMPPTLLKNGKITQNFETITNLYSPPNAREMDPNFVMAFFYSVFMGFIIGDFGYGLLTFLVGGAIRLKIKERESGFARLSAVFAAGGLFAMGWGILFNSFFGLSLPFMNTIMPDPQKDMWTFAGIAVPAVLVICLIIGVFHLLVGYFCRAVQEWRRGNFWDGVWDGLVWSAFSLGAGLAIAGLVEEAGLPVLAKAGGILAGGSLVLAMLTAGRKEKFFGKLAKGFGAVYGIINYASDILSYARLYGLMLSGAVVAQIISRYSVGFIAGGNPGLIILGLLLLPVGHVFNLAINLLGAYIHDSRLQYVEFYGKFFEGDGTLFSPLGSRHKYVRLSSAEFR